MLFVTATERGCTVNVWPIQASGGLGLCVIMPVAKARQFGGALGGYRAHLAHLPGWRSPSQIHHLVCLYKSRHTR